MHGLAGGAAAAAVGRALEVIGLEGRAGEPVSTFSGGMRRRLNLACGILHEPRVLLLDEPTVGVDPQSRERIFAAVDGLARSGTAILYSTHDMEEAERLARRIVLLDRGRIAAAGTAAELVASARLTPRLRLRTARALPERWLADVAGVRALDGAAIAKDLRLLARDRAGLVFLALAPVVVITVAGFSLAGLFGAPPGGSRAYLLPVADEDGGRLGRALRAGLADAPALEMRRVAD